MIEMVQCYVFGPNSYYSHLAKIYTIKRVPYIGDHVLFNLLNKVRKRDTMRGFPSLPSIVSLFCNEFNRFCNT